MGSLLFLQGIFPTQELNRALLHCRWILYQLTTREALGALICETISWPFVLSFLTTLRQTPGGLTFSLFLGLLKLPLGLSQKVVLGLWDHPGGIWDRWDGRGR